MPKTQPVVFKHFSGALPNNPRMPLVAVLRNEMPFLPHFLDHYRPLGVDHFVFLDDGSTDGSRDYLKAQPDVTVITANRAFVDDYRGIRFGIAARGLMAAKFFMGRWVLISDLDEFWVPPQNVADFPQLTLQLAREGHTLCRGVMLDCFPDHLNTLARSSPEAHPLDSAHWVDDIRPIVWPEGSRTAQVSQSENVRSRIVRALRERGEMDASDIRERGAPNLYKAPLALWGAKTTLLSAHRINNPYTGQRIVACAHFKFYRGWEQKLEEALARQAYYNASVEYRMLDKANRLLGDLNLLGPRSIRLSSLDDLRQFTR